MKRVLVTGADGFVGRTLSRHLSAAGYAVRAATWEAVDFRLCLDSPTQSPPGGWENTVIGDIGPGVDWSEATRGVDAIVHLAARVHVMRDDAADPLSEYRRVNTQGTEALARTAAAAGVKRFVYISTIKVNGESTQGRGPFTPNDPPAPVDPYGVSKWEAEQAVRRIAADTGLEVVVVRPSLVYGPGVRGNFEALLRLVCRGLPLPLGGISNARSLVGLDNLCDLLMRCVERPAAAGGTFLAGDGKDLSTTELVRRMAWHMGKRLVLFSMPEGLVRGLAGLLGKRDVVSRLFDSLVVDSSSARDALGWRPPVTVDDGLTKTCRWFVESRGSGDRVA